MNMQIEAHTEFKQNSLNFLPDVFHRGSFAKSEHRALSRFKLAYEY